MNVQYKSFRMVELNFDTRIELGASPDAAAASGRRQRGVRVPSERQIGGGA